METDETGTGLLELARRLWPPPATVSVSGRRARGARPPGAVALAVVPSLARPRLVLPLADPRAAAVAAAAAGSDAGRVERLSRRAFGLLTRAGALGLLARDQLLVDGVVGAGIEDELATVLGQRPAVSVRLGAARANAKPVLRAFDRRGRTLAYVKVGDHPSSAALVDREAAALALVASRTFRRFRAPIVLHHGPWNGLQLLVLSPLAGRDAPAARRPAAAMAELAGAGLEREAALVTSGFWARLRRELEALARADLRARVAGLLDRAADRVGDHPVDLGWGHGDWAPWNMAWEGDRVALWDWERFETSVPVGADAVHHAMQAIARATGDWDRALTATLEEADGLVGAAGSTTSGVDVVDLYLVDLLLRYLLAADGPLGGHIEREANWLLRTVEDRFA